MSTDTAERKALAQAVRDAASARPRELVDHSGRASRDTRLWQLLTEQMGLHTLLIDECNGGADASVADAAVVIEYLARSLSVVPALSSLGISTALLRTIDSDRSSELLTELATGTVTATVAWPRPASCDLDPVVTVVSHDGDNRVVVDGCCDFILDGAEADVILVPVALSGGPTIVALDVRQDGVVRSDMTALDLTRGMAKVEFSHARAAVLGSADLAAAFDLALVLIGAEQVGIAQHCHDTAVKWARERVQFDRPIGQFQAIKHQLVDLLMELELARSSLDVAVAAADSYLDNRSPNAGKALHVAASAAKARCGDAAMSVADQSLHILGGIGFTWEHEAHLYFRRAKTLEVFLGTPSEHRRRFGTSILHAVTG
ncbi:hypothetical protein CH263_22410 [Rhodococcus sp. 06-1059B-a]|nr:acyl-CoA dehydrogenase family protein [Rhodococcus sp. 06-1059B-a]OZD59756.1 hypothetical protein CH263_22410 [Rhodococcus sp. 06-1059B-a]